MVCAYTLRETLIRNAGGQNSMAKREEMADFADPAAVAAMLEHWREGLEAIGYLDPANPK
jgi:tRNA/rRNA methyltransferase